MSAGSQRFAEVVVDVEGVIEDRAVRVEGGTIPAPAKLLTVESGAKDDPVRHVRLRHVTLHKWTLEIATHMGVWQFTGERGLMKDIVNFVRQQCPWVLQPVE